MYSTIYSDLWLSHLSLSVGLTYVFFVFAFVFFYSGSALCYEDHQEGTWATRSLCGQSHFLIVWPQSRRSFMWGNACDGYVHHGQRGSSNVPQGAYFHYSSWTIPHHRSFGHLSELVTHATFNSFVSGGSSAGTAPEGTRHHRLLTWTWRLRHHRSFSSSENLTTLESSRPRWCSREWDDEWYIGPGTYFACRLKKMKMNLLLKPRMRVCLYYVIGRNKYRVSQKRRKLDSIWSRLDDLRHWGRIRSQSNGH